ncbi:hypothetical protein EDD11_000159 [Mortierella claussenii]|nr:hypothetical protein EDD11_000159 [Mortierella claussenii]
MHPIPGPGAGGPMPMHPNDRFGQPGMMLGAFSSPPPPPPPGMFHPRPPNWLPPGWTEHKAPDGMSYYYNATSGQSSWIRPSFPPPPGPPGVQPPPPGGPGYLGDQQPLYPPGVNPPLNNPPHLSTTTPVDSGKTKKAKKEKAVKKTRVLETPWFIVTTNLENTFFYNKETKLSIWVPTPELEQILDKMGQIATEQLEAERKAKEDETAQKQEREQMLKRPNDSASLQEDEKRLKSDTGAAAVGTEMTEDDVAWQLAAMEGMMDEDDPDQHMNSQDEDEDEDDNDDDEDDAVQQRLRMLQGSGSSSSSKPASGGRSQDAAPRLEISPHNIQEREMAFLDMLRDREVTPFDTWEKALSKIESDPRMYLIPDIKAQEALFESFCVIRAKELKDAKEKEAQQKERSQSKDKKAVERQASSSTTALSLSSSSSKPEDVYRRLVEEYTTKTSTWLDFMTKYRIDPRFLGLRPGSLRESIFRQYLSDLKKGIVVRPKSSSRDSGREKDRDAGRDRRSASSSRSSSRKYKATDSEIEEFTSLLRETKKDILHEHKNASSVEWRKIKKLIDRDRRYDAVGSSTERELLFREYADKVIQRRD